MPTMKISVSRGASAAPARWTCTRALLAGAFGALGLSASQAQTQGCIDLERRFDTTFAEVSAPQMSSFLFSAADGGCEAVVVKALKQGASLDARDRDGGTPLTHAARAGRANVIALMLDRGAVIDQRDVKGSTPLYVAIEKNRLEAAQLLIGRGANVNVEGRSGVSTVAAAAYLGDDAMVALLLAHGADGITADSTGKPPIIYAAARGAAAIVARLLAAGVDVNQHYAAEQTVLMWAAGYPSDTAEPKALALAALLLDKGARIDEADDRGRTALMTAAELEHPAMVDLLLARGAKRDARDKEGRRAAEITTNAELKAKLGG